jgi:hypothetical protein
MIARLSVLLPFHLTVPDGQQFPVYQAEDSGYGIHFYPPGRSENAPPLTEEEKITVDGVTAFQADALRIDFRKESFDRRAGTHIDPPDDVIDRAINFFSHAPPSCRTRRPSAARKISFNYLANAVFER